MKTVEQDDGLSPYFEPEAILPAQFFTGGRGKVRDSEARLMYAILEDAVHVYCTYREPATCKQRHLFRNARRWVESDDRVWLFSFLRICEALDLDPGYIRKGLRARRAAVTETAPPARTGKGVVDGAAPQLTLSRRVRSHSAAARHFSQGLAGLLHADKRYSRETRGAFVGWRPASGPHHRGQR
jgi:hypothetical protein